MDEYVVEAEGLTCRFGELIAVDKLDLHVPRGRIFGLVGPDGAGKTTTIRLLCAIVRPTAGVARVAGYDVVRQADQVHAHIGYMSQRFTLYSDLTVEENLRFFAEIFGIPARRREQRTAELLAFAGLEPFRRRRVEYLSGGMKQKLALACTLIHEPDVLMLDEPTTGVDPITRRDFWRILYTLVSRGVTILVSTPYMDEAERCNAVAFLSRGRCLAVGTPNELKRQLPWQVLALRARPQDVALRIAQEVPDVADVEVMGDLLHVFVEDAARALPVLEEALLRSGVEIRALRLVPPSMEDVFLWLISQPDEGKPSLEDRR